MSWKVFILLLQSVDFLFFAECACTSAVGVTACQRHQLAECLLNVNLV